MVIPGDEVIVPNRTFIATAHAVQLIGAISWAAIAALAGGPGELTSMTNDGRDWIITGFLGIITGALGTGHQWQRFTAVSGARALAVSLWAGSFFAVYMLFVSICGFFLVASWPAGIVLLVVVLAVATSTIDSAVAGLQFAAIAAKEIVVLSDLQATSLSSGDPVTSRTVMRIADAF